MQQHKMQMGKRQFRIADIAELLDVKKSILRVWEDGFNVPAYRSDGAGRLYSLQDVEIFALIKKQLQHNRASVDEVKKLLDERFGVKKETILETPEETVCPAQICKQEEGEEQTQESDVVEFTIRDEASKTPALVVDSIAYAEPAAQEIVLEVAQESVQEPMQATVQDVVQEVVQEMAQTPVESVSCHCKQISKELEEFKKQLIAFKEQLAR